MSTNTAPQLPAHRELEEIIQRNLAQSQANTLSTHMQALYAYRFEDLAPFAAAHTVVDHLWKAICQTIRDYRSPTEGHRSMYGPEIRYAGHITLLIGMAYADAVARQQTSDQPGQLATADEIRATLKVMFQGKE